MLFVEARIENTVLRTRYLLHNQAHAPVIFCYFFTSYAAVHVGARHPLPLIQSWLTYHHIEVLLSVARQPPPSLVVYPTGWPPPTVLLSHYAARALKPLTDVEILAALRASIIVGARLDNI